MLAQANAQPQAVLSLSVKKAKESFKRSLTKSETYRKEGKDMPLSISTNIASLSAQRSFLTSNAALRRLMSV